MKSDEPKLNTKENKQKNFDNDDDLLIEPVDEDFGQHLEIDLDTEDNEHAFAKWDKIWWTVYGDDKSPVPQDDLKVEDYDEGRHSTEKVKDY